jgi:two-component system chemotaxis response regulator CheB
VVVAEHSPTQRAALVLALEGGGDIVVVGQAATAAEAQAAVERERPDVLTMGLEMPGGGGQQAIERIMAHAPVPILGLSSTVGEGASRAKDAALDAGAANVMATPQRWTGAQAAALRRALRVLRGVPVVTRRPRHHAPPRPPGAVLSGQEVVALGASVGGPPALVTVLRELRGLDAPILCVQHIHSSFAERFAGWLGQNAGIPVVLATDGMTLTPGTVHLAPADRHLRMGARRHLTLSEDPETINRPSIDELFLSVARHAGAGARAALLTGMGDDGALGLLAIREAGGATFAQDKATSVVYGMPQVAARLGAVQQILALERIGPALAGTLPRLAA